MKQYMATEEKVFSFAERHHMFEPQDRVVVGVSGGADSVCLLFLLSELKKRIPISLYAVHVHHGIRKEADEDAAYVERLCGGMDVPFYLVRADVRKLAQEQRRSEEEMGRIVRYDAFDRIAEELEAEKIAVAHNMNDKSETMLYHLFRGSGIKGLGSIRPVRGKLVRPLLCLERPEIEAYLRERDIRFCTDATNETDDYTRNRIRHHILPYAEREISGNSVEHIARAAQELEEVENYLALQAKVLKKKCVKNSNNGYIFDVEEMKKAHPVIMRKLLYELLTELSPHGRDITNAHVTALEGLFSKAGNPSVNLPFGVVGRREYGRVILGRETDGDAKAAERAEAGEAGAEKENGGKYVLSVRIFPADAENKGKVPQKKYTKWFDYDKIEQSLMLRTRRQGDFLSVADGNGGEIRKPLKSYFINEKIPASDRDRTMLLADGAHILWVIGHRISEHYKVTGNTKRILQVQLTDGCESGSCNM